MLTLVRGSINENDTLYVKTNRNSTKGNKNISQDNESNKKLYFANLPRFHTLVTYIEVKYPYGEKMHLTRSEK